MRKGMKNRLLFLGLLLFGGMGLVGCGTPAMAEEAARLGGTPISLAPTETPSLPEPTPFVARPEYGPGELVDYTAQTGDLLPALAARFNTSVEEILAANPFIPSTATTMPPGMPMKIPIYYKPLWGTPYQIIPDGLFVNGPSQVGFDTQAFVESQPGWLKNYVSFAGGKNRTGAQIIDLVATNFSVSPQLLLALLDFYTGAVSNPQVPLDLNDYPMDYVSTSHRGVYLQLVSAADRLNDGYYRYRMGQLVEFELLDGRFERPDPWQNAATVALQYYFAQMYAPDTYFRAIGPDGVAANFRQLFGDPWGIETAHIPGSLEQPAMILPFELGKPWTLTGGPHTAWGTRMPYAALDFAPPSERSGCVESNDWATAVAPGVVVRTDEGIAVLDLDGDGDERTGWIMFYLHLAEKGRAVVGTVLETGQPIGHPSCEGGTSTGTHIHIARKYNGEWMLAEGPLGFNLDGWLAYNGAGPYQGSLKRFSHTITACECSNKASQLMRDEPRP
jgi:murein DD-endopeptidase MepM/ murein hydrolase activator NlpD